jgi:hypothetical protein
VYRICLGQKTKIIFILLAAANRYPSGPWLANKEKGRKYMRRSMLFGALLGAVIAWGVTPVRADAVDLNIDHCTGGCSSGTLPFGTVTYNQSGPNVNVSVQLTDSYYFQRSTAFDAFGFNLSGLQTITNLTSGFTYDSDGYQADGFGNFSDGIIAAATGAQFLSFTILNTNISQFGFSTNPPGDTSVLFAADIFSGLNGNTGNVGGVPSAVPGPIAGAGIPGLILALGGLILLARRRQRAAFA